MALRGLAPDPCLPAGSVSDCGGNSDIIHTFPTHKTILTLKLSAGGALKVGVVDVSSWCGLELVPLSGSNLS